VIHFFLFDENDFPLKIAINDKIGPISKIIIGRIVTTKITKVLIEKQKLISLKCAGNNSHKDR